MRRSCVWDVPSFFAAARSERPASRRSLLTAAATDAASGSGFASSGRAGAGATGVGVGCSGTGGDDKTQAPPALYSHAAAGESGVMNQRKHRAVYAVLA